MKTVLLRLLLVLAAGCTGCREGHSDPSPGTPGKHASAHAHTAPHGGTLVELGEHQFNVELVHDSTSGRLTAYFLNAHAEDFVRLASPSVEIRTEVNGKPEKLILVAVPDSRTGEKVGNTSRFEAQADWLKQARSVGGEFGTLELPGNQFVGVKFRLGTP